MSRDYTGGINILRDRQQFIDIIKQRLSPNRWQHSLQVAETAVQMAGQYELTLEQVYLTALLHDYAKGLSGQELLQLAEENNLIEDEVDREVPDLLHAPVGAFLVKRDLGIEDEEVLTAISRHTLGSTKMSELDKIIYLADMIEPGRDFAGLERLKCLSFRDLDEAMLFGLESTIKYCLDRGRILHPRTIEARNYFLSIIKR